jgi:cell cycle sensor histidine kinase DivJ
MEWVDDWLSGLVHRSTQGDIAERARHERFIVGRTVTTLVALAGLPPYLLASETPTALEALALLALAAPLAGVFIASRHGRLVAGQAVVSFGLTLFVAGAAIAFGGAHSLAALALLVVPLDALLCGSRRAVLAAGLIALAGLGAMAALQSGGFSIGQGSALAAIFMVAASLGLGHTLAQAVGDWRLRALLKAAKRSGEAREETALQTIDDLVTWHDRNGAVLRANAGASRLLGAASTALQGHGLFARIHVADRPAFLKAISDAAASAEPVVVQFRLKTGCGPEEDLNGRLAQRAPIPLIWAEMRAHRLKDGEGGAVIAVTRDISEHKRLADDLETLRQEAVSAGETRANLLATVSHELRTPLNALIGYAEMLTGRGTHGIAPASPDRAADYAEIICQSGQHMLGVVNTLLDLSTIESGHYKLSPEPIAVGAAVEECCRYLTLTAERSGVALVKDLSAELPPLTADRRAFQQILLNLLSNAVKFTPKGGRVTVGAHLDGGHLALTVRDTGVGVCESELPRLGNPFYRGTAAATFAEKGSGLGLSVVRGLVALHSGRMSIASARGDGTSVTVMLPVGSGPVQLPGETGTAPERGRTGRTGGTPDEAHAGPSTEPVQLHAFLRSAQRSAPSRAGMRGHA